MREYLTTGQAAELCSVTPDAVLKWVKAGKIPANRTPGGHYRIRRTDIQSMITVEQEPQVQEVQPSRPFQYCWEFNASEGETKEECVQCIVYRSKASRCYEISRLPAEAGHSKLYCTESCDDCDYYRVVRGQRKNVLVVTDSHALRTQIETGKDDFSYNIRFTDCEYNCSMLIENYRADFVILDCAMGKRRTRQFAQHVAVDPRIPFVKIIMVGGRHEFPKECNKEVFANIERPFSMGVLGELIGSLSKDSNFDPLSARQ